MELSPNIKQLLVASSPLLASLSVGGAVSFPTVLLHQLKRNDTEITLDFDTASWIGAIHGLAGIPSILMPTVMQWKGRKLSLIITYLVAIVGWILACTANNVWTLLISECFHGFGTNSIYAVSYLSMSEMIAPSYRDLFIKMYYIMEMIVMALNGIMTHYLHWKTISMIMCVPMALALIVACFWPESPYWLAYKGEFERCEESFHWLRGTDDISDKELRQLITAQMDNIACNKLSTKKSFMDYFKQIRSKDFYIPAIHMSILQYLIYAVGSIVLFIYSIEVFKKAYNNENITFFASVIVNGTQVCGIVVTIFLGKYFKKKTILLSSTFAATLSLAGASATSYLETINFLEKESLTSLYFIIAYLISLSLGILPVTYCIASELMSVKHRGVGGVLYVTNTCVFHTASLKLAPYFFLYINLYGTFLVYAVNGLVCGILTWKFVPDTQGKTLQEIEAYYLHGRFDRRISCSKERDCSNEEMLQN